MDSIPVDRKVGSARAPARQTGGRNAAAPLTRQCQAVGRTQAPANREETLFDQAPLVPGLTVYGLRNFPGEVAGRGRSAVGVLDGFTATTSVHVEYVGSDGATVVVASSVGGREALQYFVLSNLALTCRDRGDAEFQDNDPRAALFERFDDGSFAWEEGSLLVSGAVAPFEVLEIGRGWAAVGAIHRTDVGLYAYTFPLEDTHLVPITT